MKKYIFCLLASCLTCCFSLGATFQYQGLTESQVIARLGKPKGVVDMKDSKTFMYERGNLTFQRGKVTASSFLSDEEYTNHINSREEARKRWSSIEAEQKKLLHERGLKLKEDKLRDPEFLSLPLDKQITFWRNFKAMYPEISVEPTLTELVQSYQETMRNIHLVELNAEYKERIAQAEERVAQAEKELAKLKNAMAYQYQQTPVYYLTPPPTQPVIRVIYNKKEHSHQR